MKIQKFKIVDNVAKEPLYRFTRSTHGEIEGLQGRSSNSVPEGNLQVDAKRIGRVTVKAHGLTSGRKGKALWIIK